MGLCLTVNLPILFESVHDHSGGDIPGPIPNPEVKTSCVVPCTVVREPTGKVVVVSLSPFAFTGASAPVGATSPHFFSIMADRLDLNLNGRMERSELVGYASRLRPMRVAGGLEVAPACAQLVRARPKLRRGE